MESHLPACWTISAAHYHQLERPALRMLQHACSEGTWVESMADPIGGEIHKDESGRASGLLSEAAAMTLDWPYHIIHLRTTIRRTEIPLHFF
jgi:hypothetical protein